MSNLSTLRNPIAHCTELAEDEALRLRLSMKDWFRQMEKAAPWRYLLSREVIDGASDVAP
jgi:hypothetical protein